jgi:hypothetical protein
MKRKDDFVADAEQILALPIECPVNELGGYGAQGEVIYETHPNACPSILVDEQGIAKASFMSNGSTEFVVKLPESMEINVLDAHFDPVEKREIGIPSANVWFSLPGTGAPRAVSLMNPQTVSGLTVERIRIVKIGDPERALWYCATLKGRGILLETALRHRLVDTPKGPALLRDVCVLNRGKARIDAQLWTNFNLHGTQRFVYNKELWYDAGLPLSNKETVVCATVPYSDILQIKRISSVPRGMRAVDATCDYTTFIGDTSALAILPEAVRRGEMLKGGAGRKLNRFSTAALAANQFGLGLKPGATATLRQSLLYVTDQRLLDRFRKESGSRTPRYSDTSAAFVKAASQLIEKTPGPLDIKNAAGDAARQAPAFALEIPEQPVATQYANSIWIGVKELYEKCRAHGEELADGIELGTRDRGQDMWPKMKEDPGRVREDLVHAFSFLYITVDGDIPSNRRLTLREKLHGMFPRQYPSRWDDRSKEVMNDNRPYSDSPLWLIDSANMYIRETGDASILAEKVKTIRLTDPDHPETSGIVGCERVLTIADVIREILACFERHVDDSPYGFTQSMYGEWCDAVDMYGTSVIGDDKTRGHGRGSHVRLSAQLFLTLVETLDTMQSSRVQQVLSKKGLAWDCERQKALANRLRQNIVRVAWEEMPGTGASGFLNVVHELKKDGKRPRYSKGEIGYTLGSMRGTDYDGIRRRELGTQAFGLEMLLTNREYLQPVKNSDKMVAGLLATVDKMFFDRKLGLVMFTTPMANNMRTVSMVGRIGVVPSGCAENGEYHHCQAFMHRYRLSVPGQADMVWKQFKPIMSAMRDASIGGPFESPCTSYVSDPEDPHFGKAMYFGLSGSTDWIVEVFQKIAGVQLALHDDSQPDVRIAPNLPRCFKKKLRFQRIIHVADGTGGYRRVPLDLHVSPAASHATAKVRINGKAAEKAEIKSLDGLKRLRIEVEMA